MKHSLTEYTNKRDTGHYGAKLKRLYSLIPRTKCTRDNCRKECCSKTVVKTTLAENFTSLPLVYSVEYWNIDNYLNQFFSPEERKRFYDIELESRQCVFFNEETLQCVIYDARPLSCRLFGLRLPNKLWGVELEKVRMDSIYCKHNVVLEQDKYKKFIESYHSFWDWMAIWSVENPVYNNENKEIIRKQTEFESLYLLGWMEFNRLRFSSVECLKEEFGEFWKSYKESI